MHAAGSLGALKGERRPWLLVALSPRGWNTVGHAPALHGGCGQGRGEGRHTRARAAGTTRTRGARGPPGGPIAAAAASAAAGSRAPGAGPGPRHPHPPNLSPAAGFGFPLDRLLHPLHRRAKKVRGQLASWADTDDPGRCDEGGGQWPSPGAGGGASISRRAAARPRPGRPSAPAPALRGRGVVRPAPHCPCGGTVRCGSPAAPAKKARRWSAHPRQRHHWLGRGAAKPQSREAWRGQAPLQIGSHFFDFLPFQRPKSPNESSIEAALGRRFYFSWRLKILSSYGKRKGGA